VQAPTDSRQPDGRWAERSASANYDCNNDGVTDVFVAQPFFDTSIAAPDVGRVHLMSGKSLADGTNVRLATFDSPEPQVKAAFGFFISVLDNNPGSTADVPNIAIGTDAQDVGGYTDQGKAWVFPGCGGSALFALDNPYPQGAAGNSARFGSRIGRAGDINGDGVTDIIVGASGNDVPAQTATNGITGCGQLTMAPTGCRKDQGQAFIFNGVNGALLRQMDYPVEDQVPAGTCNTLCGSFGIAVQGPGDSGAVPVGGADLNGLPKQAGLPDGFVDHLVDATGFGGGIGRMYLFDGSSTVPTCQTTPLNAPASFTGCEKLIRKINDPIPHPAAFFGFQDVTPLSPGDVGSVDIPVTGPDPDPVGVPSSTPDGYADIYGQGFLQEGATGPAEGKAWVFDGRTGQVLYQIDDVTPSPGGQFGWSMDKTTYKPTLNGPEVNALLIGASPHFIPGNQNGGLTVRNASNGLLLEELPIPVQCTQLVPTTTGPNLGWTVSAPGDLDGDGLPDYIGGSPFMNVATQAGVKQPDAGLLFVFNSKADGPTPPCPPGGPLDE